MSGHFQWVLSSIAVAVLGCMAEPNNSIQPEQRWPTSGTQESVEEPVPLSDRQSGLTYGLPKAGQASIQDLVDLLPEEDIGFDGDKFFSASAQPLTCTGGRTAQTADLPMTVEAVVTIPGTYYIKVSVCDQEEKFYGSFVVEDDTGGIMVLRDSRVAQVQPGDVVRLTVHTLAISDNFGRVASRAVLSYDLEKVPTTQDVLYSTETAAITSEQVGQTLRVAGYVLEHPTNLNFSTMILSDEEIPESDDTVSSVCRNYCGPACSDACVSTRTSDVCETRICPYLCQRFDALMTDEDPTDFLVAELPTCWTVGLQQELLRRGYDFADAKRIQATGPVLQDYDSLTVTVEKLGQIEVLE